MNIDNKEKTILCYGDSNTWGFIAEKADYENNRIERYSRDIRWPCRLQALLGKKYYVVEEGLNGRTTNLDTPIPPDRNGRTYLDPCLYSHAPIDLVIFLLGGNDLKSYFSRSAEEISLGLSELIDIVQLSKYGSALRNRPDILVLSNPVPLVKSEEYVDEKGTFVFKGAIKKATKLIPLYEKLSYEKCCYFLDITPQVEPGVFDGMHLDELGHERLATVVASKVNEIFSEIDDS